MIDGKRKKEKLRKRSVKGEDGKEDDSEKRSETNKKRKA
jgi:hypothetical protein